MTDSYLTTEKRLFVFSRRGFVLGGGGVGFQRATRGRAGGRAGARLERARARAIQTTGTKNAPDAKGQDADQQEQERARGPAHQRLGRGLLARGRRDERGSARGRGTPSRPPSSSSSSSTLAGCHPLKMCRFRKKLVSCPSTTPWWFGQTGPLPARPASAVGRSMEREERRGDGNRGCRRFRGRREGELCKGRVCAMIVCDRGARDRA